MRGHTVVFNPTHLLKNYRTRAAVALRNARDALHRVRREGARHGIHQRYGNGQDRAVVAGAEVVITNVTGSATHTTSTNSDGAYVVAGLPGGSYNIVVTAKGFSRYSAKNVVLDVAQKIRVDVVLTVGAVTEEVMVTGESVAQVETQSSDLTSTITGKQIDNLVLNGRNFTQLVNLAPGVVSQTGQDDAKVGVYGNVAYSMNGGRTEYNNWELDGGDNMDNGSNATLNVYPNPEAIAEFKVLTSNYEYGPPARNRGGGDEEWWQRLPRQRIRVLAQ